MGRLTAASRGISRQPRLDFPGPPRLRLSSFSFVARGTGGMIIETFCFLSHNPATNETLEGTQLALIIRCDKTDRVSHRVRATGPADSVDVILRVHREVVVHHVRDAVDINAARRDIGRDQDAQRPRFKIMQRA